MTLGDLSRKGWDSRSEWDVGWEHITSPAWLLHRLTMQLMKRWIVKNTVQICWKLKAAPWAWRRGDDTVHVDAAASWVETDVDQLHNGYSPDLISTLGIVILNLADSWNVYILSVVLYFQAVVAEFYFIFLWEESHRKGSYWKITFTWKWKTLPRQLFWSFLALSTKYFPWKDKYS